MIHPFRAGSPEADAATLDALHRAGADLTKETEVIFFLYFPTRELAERAVESIRNPTFIPEITPAAGDPTRWLCQVTSRIVPSVSTIRDASVRFHAVAATLHGEYDGWVAQAQPIKPVAPPAVNAAIKWWVTLASYVTGPALVYNTHRLPPTISRALLTSDDEQAMPVPIHTYLDDNEQALAAVGFTTVARTISRRALAGGMT
jgi:hypothetical protein